MLETGSRFKGRDALPGSVPLFPASILELVSCPRLSVFRLFVFRRVRFHLTASRPGESSLLFGEKNPHG
jgi:hypothetical protein